MKKETLRFCHECQEGKNIIDFPILWCGNRSYFCRECRKKNGDQWEDFIKEDE